MVDGRQRDQWRHTASILCQTANIYRDTKKRRSPFKFGEFYPFKVKKTKPDIPQVPFSTLKSVFVGKPIRGK